MTETWCICHPEQSEAKWRIPNRTIIPQPHKIELLRYAQYDTVQILDTAPRMHSHGNNVQGRHYATARPTPSASSPRPLSSFQSSTAHSPLQSNSPSDTAFACRKRFPLAKTALHTSNAVNRANIYLPQECKHIINFSIVRNPLVYTFTHICKSHCKICKLYVTLQMFMSTF